MDLLQSLNKRGQHNWTKMVCLAIGLAVGVVLIGKVGFEQSFDDFFPASPRTYTVCEDIIRDGEYKHFPQTAGAVAPGLQSYCPQVEAATRFTTFAMQTLILTDDDRRVRGNYALVDSCFFDVFPFRILEGDAKSVLSRPDYCMISRSLAEKLGGGEDVVGTTIYDSKRGALPLTIGGIYEDIPLNSTLHELEVMVSMPTIAKVMWDGRDNWVGNDRYRSFVRLAEGFTPDDLAPQIDKMKHERLPVQLASAAFLVILLVVTARQYRLMVTNDPGYDYATLGMIQADEIEQRELVVEELRKLSKVKGVTTATVMLTSGQSGDNIYLPDDEREYMNVADLFDVGDGYFDVMGLHVVSGRTFTEGTDTLRECMVSRRFEEKMRELAGWDTAVGKEIFCTSYQGLHTIVGVYDDPQIGSLSMPEHRPSICFYCRQMRHMPIILIRFHSMEALEDANAVLRRLVPDNPDLAVYPYSQIITQLYTDAQRFRSTVLIGSIIALLIALIGLIGYLAGEVSRRQKEIAIRKVNGAYITDVLRLFQRDILRMALPAVVVGSTAAYFVARLWLQQFSRQTPLTPWLFALCAAAVLVVVIAVVAARSWRIAAGNPVNYLKTE